MSQQVSQHNTYIEQRLSEIMLFSLFQWQDLPQSLETTLSPEDRNLNQHSEQLPQIVGWRIREFKWIS